MKKTILIFVLLIAMGLGIFFYFEASAKSKIIIAGEKIKVEIADTPARHIKGLSGTPRLPANKGMLFIFPAPDRYGFWMKDMNYALDIIWLDGDGRVVHIEENVLPETYPKVFTPEAAALYVIEVNAGFAQRYGLKIGDEAILH